MKSHRSVPVLLPDHPVSLLVPVLVPVLEPASMSDLRSVQPLELWSVQPLALWSVLLQEFSAALLLICLFLT